MKFWQKDMSNHLSMNKIRLKPINYYFCYYYLLKDTNSVHWRTQMMSNKTWCMWYAPEIISPIYKKLVFSCWNPALSNSVICCRSRRNKLLLKHPSQSHLFFMEFCFSTKHNKSKVGKFSQQWPKGSLFNTYYTEV